MCGIVACFNVPRETVGMMVSHQTSRGPDFNGVKQIDNVIFGHNLLAIVDKSEGARQPIHNGGLFSYNGETYLIGNHIIDYLPSDTKAIHRELIQPEADIDKILNSMNGMFSFAWYNGETITIARDRFGIKPLYYHVGEGYFASASTPAAVALTKPNWDISKKGLQEYLALGATTLHSLFDGIVAVPPGHYVTFNCKTNEATVKRWYYPKYVDGAIKTIEEKVVKAIDRVKLTCDWPQIILLSGGIDSTLVASRYVGNSAIHLRSPEQEYAEQVAKKFDINLITADPQESSAETDLIDYITKSGDPTMAGLIPYITCKEIAKQGYRVAITANGADELFWGYDRMKNVEDQQKAIFRDFSFTQDVIYDLLNFSAQPSNGAKTALTQWLEIYSYLMFDLNKTLDFASMCHSVEVRVPYLDHELVEAALSIPQEVHTGQFGNKTILKKMLNELGFDWSFIHRPKMGFSLYHPPGDWNSLQDKAMRWYNRMGFEQPIEPTGRQQAYHQTTVVGLYLWYRIYKPNNIA